MYKSKLNLKETQQAIQDLKFAFTKKLNKELSLTRVSAPLFVLSNSKINDGLNGDIPVMFKPKQWNEELEIVHSLAKWKRYALKKYNFLPYEGLWADMNAIRKDDEVDYKHSLYVDQWDWELIIKKEDRHIDFLKKIVNTIYESIRYVENKLVFSYPVLSIKLPKKITFISSKELYEMYPNLSPEEREDKFVEKVGAMFVYQIGNNLPDNQPHSKRAFDYDDWNLNGDIVVWDNINKKALELSSMGIRVDANSLKNQMSILNKTENDLGEYHNQIFKNQLPLTIGGGIGQSRLSMFLLEKKHIGEVQVSIWPKEMKDKFKLEGVELL